VFVFVAVDFFAVSITASDRLERLVPEMTFEQDVNLYSLMHSCVTHCNKHEMLVQEELRKSSSSSSQES